MHNVSLIHLLKACMHLQSQRVVDKIIDTHLSGKTTQPSVTLKV